MRKEIKDEKETDQTVGSGWPLALRDLGRSAPCSRSVSGGNYSFRHCRFVTLSRRSVAVTTGASVGGVKERLGWLVRFRRSWFFD